MVRSLSYALLLAVTISGVGAGQQAKKTDDPAGRELLRLEDSWAAGLVKRDGALFRRLLAPGFVYTEDDKLMTRDVVLRGWLVVSGRGKTGAFTHRYRFTDTWVRQKGAWQIVAAQDYLVK